MRRFLFILEFHDIGIRMPFRRHDWETWRADSRARVYKSAESSLRGHSEIVSLPVVSKNGSITKPMTHVVNVDDIHMLRRCVLNLGCYLCSGPLEASGSVRETLESLTPARLRHVNRL